MRLSIIIFIGAILISSCTTGQNGAKSQTIKLKQNDAEYTLLKKGKGKSSAPGDYILFSLLLKGNDGNVLVDRREESKWAKEKVRDVDSTTQAIVEMLFNLTEGDSVKMLVPLDKEHKPRGLENVDTLIYYIKAEEILDEEAMNKKIEEQKAEQTKKLEAAKVVEGEIATKVSGLLADYKAGKLKDKLQKTSTGVEYYIVEKGNGPKVEKGDNVKVAYYGVLKDDGKMFDNSFGRGEDIEFNAGQGMMIKGWDDAMLELKEGDKAILFIPYNLAYGENGRAPVIPAKADLVFYIEVNKVNKSKK